MKALPARLLCSFLSFGVAIAALAGCGGAAQSLSSAGADSPAASAISPEDGEAANLKDYETLTKTYLNPAFYSGVARSSWNFTEEIAPDDLVNFYTYLEVSGELDYPEGYAQTKADDPLIPAEEVERQVACYFDVSAEQLRKSAFYHADSNTYEIAGIGGGASSQVVGAKQNGSRLALDFEVYSPADEVTVIWGGTLTVELSGDGFRYLSCVKRDFADEGYLDTLTETYVQPLMSSGAILLASWETPEEIAADDLVCFCAFNNLLNKPVTPSGGTIAKGAAYLDNAGPATEVEAAVQKYFDVPKEYLRSSKLYNFHDQDTGIQYQDAYMLPHGFGGGGSTKALAAEQNGERLLITVGIFGPDGLETPVITGTLTVVPEKDEFKYVSYDLPG